MSPWRGEYRLSVKSIETEDPVDLLLYRPAGFAFAKLGSALGLSPTHLTLAGMGAGIMAGLLFSQPTPVRLLAASLLFLFSGILDSADGQLARISGRSTQFGLMLDGLCDNIVFASVYVGCIWPLLPSWGAWIWPLAVAAGLSHSLQSATLDFYLREYLYYTGKDWPEDYRNPSPNEAHNQIREAATTGERGLWRLRYSWLSQQQLLNTRSNEVRKVFRKCGNQNNEVFQAIYRKIQLPQLRIWQVLGANVHTMGIVLFAWLVRFDLYLAMVDLTILNLWMIFAWRVQGKSDRRMEATFLSHAKIMAKREFPSDELRQLRRPGPRA